MKDKTKYFLLSGLVFLVIYIGIFILFSVIFPNVAGGYRAFICGVITAIVSPRLEKRTTLSGSKIYLVRIFSQRSFNR